jgi:hypothetical protein
MKRNGTGYILATTNEDVCLVSCGKALDTARQIADQLKIKVTIRDALTDTVIGTVSPKR